MHEFISYSQKLYKYFEPILFMEKLRLRLRGFVTITHVSKESGISMKSSSLWVIGDFVSLIFWISVIIAKSVFTPELHTMLSCSVDFHCLYNTFSWFWPFFFSLYLKYWERGCLIQFPTFLFKESLSVCIFNIIFVILESIEDCDIHQIVKNYQAVIKKNYYHI